MKNISKEKDMLVSCLFVDYISRKRLRQLINYIIIRKQPKQPLSRGFKLMFKEANLMTLEIKEIGEKNFKSRISKDSIYKYKLNKCIKNN